MKSNEKNPWWKFPVAILVFILIYFFLPVIVGVALSITNFFSPEFYKNSSMWIFVASDIFSVAVGFISVNEILKKQNFVFQSVFAAAVAVYSFVVAITNWMYGATNADQFIGGLAMGVTAIVFVGINCKNIAKEMRGEGK